MHMFSDHADDKMEMLKWLNEKSGDIPIGELADMMGEAAEDEPGFEGMLSRYE